MGTVEPQVAHSGAVQEVTDGFHLVIDAFKLNGIDTIFVCPVSRSRTSPAWHRPQACA